MDYVFFSFVNAKPSSNKIYIGTAKKICEIISGGVRIIPTKKQKIRKIPLYSLSSFFVIRPKEIIALINNGI